MADLSAEGLENKRLSWAGSGHVRDITLPNIARRRGWVERDSERCWQVTAALVPESMRHHRNGFLKQTALKLELLYADRHRLDDSLWRGDVKLHEAMPQLLRRRAKRHGAKKTKRLNKRGRPIYRPFRLSAEQLAANQRAAEQEPFISRRGDLLMGVGRVVMVFGGFSHYKSGFLIDPHKDGYPMSLEKIAKLAGESYEAAKDALDWLEHWGFIDFVKRNVEHRAELRPDGTKRWRHRTMRPSWRRFRWDRWIACFGGHLYKEAFENAGRKREAPKRAPKPEQEQRDPRLVEAVNTITRAWDSRPSLPPATRTPYDKLTVSQKQTLWDAVAADHPEWIDKDWQLLEAEAKRRAEAPPNAEGAAEPETSDSAE